MSKRIFVPHSQLGTIKYEFMLTRLNFGLSAEGALGGTVSAANIFAQD